MVPPIRDKEPYLTALVASSRNTGQNGVASSGRNVTGSPSRRYREDHRSYKAQAESERAPRGRRPPSATRSAECVRSLRPPGGHQSAERSPEREGVCGRALMCD
jgi:hypothetical protein